jgi:hypothetical protein
LISVNNRKTQNDRKLIMKAINCKKTLLASALIAMSGLSTSTLAADGTFGLNFTTVPDVSISQVIGLNFGDDLQLATGSTCTLAVDASSTNTPSSAAGLLDVSGDITEGTDFQLRSGNCDSTSTSDGIVGKYVINGAEGVTVSITVNPIITGSGGNFAFSPQGVASNYAAAADDTFVALAPGVGQTATADVRLHSSADADQGGTSSPFPGQSFLFIGGTLTADTQLTAGTVYAASTFVVDVTY